MNKSQKFLLLFIGFCMAAIVGLVAFNVFMPKPEVKPDQVQVMERSVQEEVAEEPKADVMEVQYVNIYFIGKNEHDEAYDK